MPAIPDSTRSSIVLRLLDHAEKNWPQLKKVQARYHASFAYIIGVLPDGEELPLFRLRYGGSAHSFGFAIYSAARDRYEDAVLLTGMPVGSPQEALDTACTVHLAGTGNEPPDYGPDPRRTNGATHLELAMAVVGGASSLAALGAVYTRTGSLGGWDPASAVVLLGTFQIVSGLRAALVDPNVQWFHQRIEDGRFDHILTQPASSLFLATLGGCAPAALVQSVVGAAVVTGGLVAQPHLPGAGAVLGWLLLVAAATAVTWATRTLVAAVPAGALVRGATPAFGAAAVAAAAVLCALTAGVWHRGLRRYTSAAG